MIEPYNTKQLQLASLLSVANFLGLTPIDPKHIGRGFTGKDIVKDDPRYTCISFSDLVRIHNSDKAINYITGSYFFRNRRYITAYKLSPRIIARQQFLYIHRLVEKVKLQRDRKAEGCVKLCDPWVRLTQKGALLVDDTYKLPHGLYILSKA